MRIGSSVFVAFLVVMTSCGTSPEGQPDTEGVAERTPTFSFETTEESSKIPDIAPLPPPPVAPSPAISEGTRVGFTAGNRFVVFAREEEPSFVVFDRDRGETFRVLGAPLGDAHPTYDRYADVGLAPGALQWSLEGDGHGRILVRSTGGVQLVDLADHGRMIAAWRGTPIAASVAPDGAAFAVSTRDAMHIVRASDGAIGSFPASFGDSSASAHWGTKNVYFVTKEELTRVDRETLKPAKVKAHGDDARFAMSADAEVIAVAAGGTVVVYASSESESAPKPVMRLPAPDLVDIRVQADGANVVWVEQRIDETNSDNGHLHTIDVAARTHVRFAMVNSGCGNAPEYLQEVADGKIKTDPSCAIGCPSVRWTRRTVVYDAKTGAKLEDESYTEEKSWNEQQGELRDEVESLANKLHVKLEEMTHQPAKDGGRFLLAKEKGLELVAPKTSDGIPLEASKDAYLAGLTFSNDGALVAGMVDGRARVWEAATGRAILR